MKISIVVPVYKSENVLKELLETILDNILQMSYEFELILINDGSPDSSWEIIKDFICTNSKVSIKKIKFTRNYGQHNAIHAGLLKSSGDKIIVMDCDMQDNPKFIPNLVNESINNLIVLAKRNNRKDNILKRYSSKLFYYLFKYLSGSDIDSSVANFGIYDRKVINTIIGFPEKMRFFPFLVRLTGFSISYLNVEHSKSHRGKSSYTIKKLLNLALDIILSNSNKPLKIIIKLGFIISITSFIFAIYIFILFILGRIYVKGYTSMMISIWFLGGVILFSIGAIGLYIDKIFESVKNRPNFIIEEEL